MRMVQTEGGILIPESDVPELAQGVVELQQVGTDRWLFHPVGDVAGWERDGADMNGKPRNERRQGRAWLSRKHRVSVSAMALRQDGRIWGMAQVFSFRDPRVTPSRKKRGVLFPTLDQLRVTGKFLFGAEARCIAEMSDAPPASLWCPLEASGIPEWPDG